MEIVIEKIGNLKERFDVNYYKNEYKELDKKLNNSKWKIESLEDLGVEISGGATPKLDKYNTKYTTKEKGVPFLRVKNIGNTILDLKGLKYITKETHERDLNRSKLKGGDLVFTITGRLGDTSIIPKNFIANINQHSVKISLENALLSKFLSIYFSTNKGNKLSTRAKTGGTREALDYKEIKKIKIPIPPKDIQEKIIKIFDKALNNKQKKEKEAKELIDSIDRYMLKELGIQEPKLTEKMTFRVGVNDLISNRLDVEYHKGMYKKINMYIKNSIFTTRKVKNIVEYMKTGAEVNVKNYLDFGKYFFINVSNVSNLKIDIEKNIKAINEKTYLDNIENRPNKNEILFTKYGSIGNVAIVENEDNVIVGTHILRIKIINRINNYFLLYLLNSNIFRSLVKSLKKGGVIPRIDIRDIENFDIPIPPKSVQDKIAKEAKKRLDKAHKLKEEGNRGFEKAKLEIEDILLS